MVALGVASFTAFRHSVPCLHQLRQGVRHLGHSHYGHAHPGLHVPSPRDHKESSVLISLVPLPLGDIDVSRWCALGMVIRKGFVVCLLD